MILNNYMIFTVKQIEILLCVLSHCRGESARLSSLSAQGWTLCNYYLLLLIINYKLFFLLLGAGLSAAPALLSAQVSPGDCQGQQGAGGGEEREGDIRREGKGREERQQREREI